MSWVTVNSLKDNDIQSTGGGHFVVKVWQCSEYKELRIVDNNCLLALDLHRPRGGGFKPGVIRYSYEWKNGVHL